MHDHTNEDILSADLSINPIVADRIQSITKWARFLGIVGAIFLALFLLLVIVFSTQISQLGTIYPVIGLFPVAIIYFIVFVGLVVSGILLYFLLRFSIQTRRAIQLRSQELLNKGLESLKIYFTIYGVISIILVVLNLFGLLTSL